MIGKGTAAIGSETHPQDDARQVYSFAPGYAYARRPWVAHPIVQVTGNRVFIDFDGRLHPLDRAELERQGRVFASGMCFYSETTVRQLASELSSGGEAAASKPLPPQVGDDGDLLGLGPAYTRAQVMATFRRRAFELHRDRGCDARRFGRLVQAKKQALARIGR